MSRSLFGNGEKSTVNDVNDILHGGGEAITKDANVDKEADTINVVDVETGSGEYSEMNAFPLPMEEEENDTPAVDNVDAPSTQENQMDETPAGNDADLPMTPGRQPTPPEEAIAVGIEKLAVKEVHTNILLPNGLGDMSGIIPPGRSDIITAGGGAVIPESFKNWRPQGTPPTATTSSAATAVDDSDKKGKADAKKRIPRIGGGDSHSSGRRRGRDDDIGRRSVVNTDEDERARKRGEKGGRGKYKETRSCFICGKVGHVKAYCYKRNRVEKKRKRESSSSEDEDESETQKKMKQAAKILSKGSRVYDVAMKAAAIMRGTANEGD